MLVTVAEIMNRNHAENRVLHTILKSSMKNINKNCQMSMELA